MLRYNTIRSESLTWTESRGCGQLILAVVTKKMSIYVTNFYCLMGWKVTGLNILYLAVIVRKKNLAGVTDESKIRIFDVIFWRYMYGLMFTLIADADLVVHFVVSE